MHCYCTKYIFLKFHPIYFWIFYLVSTLFGFSIFLFFSFHVFKSLQKDHFRVIEWNLVSVNDQFRISFHQLWELFHHIIYSLHPSDKQKELHNLKEKEKKQEKNLGKKYETKKNRQKVKEKEIIETKKESKKERK